MTDRRDIALSLPQGRGLPFRRPAGRRSHIHAVGCWSSRSKSATPMFHRGSRVERRRWPRPARSCATHLRSRAGWSPAPKLEGLRRRIDHGRPYIRNVCCRLDGSIYMSRRYGLESAPCPSVKMRRVPWRRRRGLRRRHRPRRNPGVVVAAKPVGGPVAGRARLRPVLARQRGRCAEIPDVTLHEPDGYKYSAISRRSPFEMTDRKSTRLNSSHLVISYAGFCLKKKNINHIPTHITERC